MRSGIKIRLMLPLLIVIAALFSVFVVFLNMRLREISRQEIVGTVENVGEVAVQLVRSPLFYGDYGNVANALHPLLLSDFDYFLVIDTVTGNTAFQSDSGNILLADYTAKFKNLDQFGRNSRRLVAIGGKSYYEFVFPVFVANVRSQLGLVVIGINQKRISDKLFPITLWIMAMGFATISLVLIAAYVVANRFIRPLQQLTRTMSDFSTGNLAARSDISSRDEIGLLSTSFNQMAGKINEQIVSIEKYSLDLEKMVEERSRKLMEALSELRDKDIKLEQAKRIRSLSDMITSITHQINNPMAIISGQVQMIEAENKNSQVAKRLRSIENSIDRIDDLIRDITFYLSLRDVHLEEKPIRDLVLTIASEWIGPEIKVVFGGFDEPPVKISINTELMTVALKNMVLNAVDAVSSLPGEKRIEFRLSREEGQLQLEIEDNGPGIAEPERAFDPFYPHTPERSGMGLTFAYQIIQIHNGEIKIANTGGGTRITMRFPVRDRETGRGDKG